MKHVSRINIGNTHFVIHSNISSDLTFFDGDNCYDNFEKQQDVNKNDSPRDIEVFINLGNPPLRGNFRKLYSGTDSWSIYSDDTGYAFTLQPPDTVRPVWTAVTDLSFSKVSLYLDNQLPPHYPMRYPLDQILLFHHLAGRQGAIIHAAGMICNRKGYIFPGISGAGKTTLTNLLKANKTFTFLSDDRMVIRRQEKEYRCFGTPWPGDAGIAENKHAPLTGIYFLHQALDSAISRISPREAFERFMPVASIPWYHETLLNKLFDFFQELVKKVSVYDLHFSPSTELSEFIEKSIAQA